MFFDPEYPDVPIPDTLDHVVEVADMMAILAAQRLCRIEELRREAMADAAALGRGFPDVVERGVRLELAAAMRITEHAAARLMTLADALVHRYPAALESLGRARMTERHAETLVAELDPLEPAVRDRLTGRAVQLAEAEPVGAFRRRLRRLVETARADTLEQRHREALRARRVAIEAADDGMSWLHVYAPTVEVHAVFERVTAIAKALTASDDRDARSLGEVRADVACDLLIDGEVDAHGDGAHGIRATVAVTVPALTLLCETDADRAGKDLPPAVLDGVGPIPLATAKRLCGGDAGWMRVLTHPETGAVLSVGRTQYAPPASLKRLVRWRADRCMAPGCGMPSRRCDIDHTVAWEHGGATSIDNLAPLCRGHHRVKHDGGWTIVQRDGGAVEWTSPTGRRYLVEPERRMPVFQPSAPAMAPF